MAKETSARIAKIAGRALEDPYSISGADIKALAASALVQREADLRWPTWGALDADAKEIVSKYLTAQQFNALRLVVQRIAKKATKQ